REFERSKRPDGDARVAPEVVGIGTHRFRKDAGSRQGLDLCEIALPLARELDFEIAKAGFEVMGELRLELARSRVTEHGRIAETPGDLLQAEQRFDRLSFAFTDEIEQRELDGSPGRGVCVDVAAVALDPVGQRIDVSDGL